MGKEYIQYLVKSKFNPEVKWNKGHVNVMKQKQSIWYEVILIETHKVKFYHFIKWWITFHIKESFSMFFIYYYQLIFILSEFYWRYKTIHVYIRIECWQLGSWTNCNFFYIKKMSVISLNAVFMHKHF